jgi:site-specific DNA recombinase
MLFADLSAAYVQFAGVTIGADRGPGGVRNFNCRSVGCVENPEGSVANADSHTRITAWANANGYELVSVYTDAGLSGGRADNRPGLQSALDHACRAKAALVVYSLSRLARSTKDAIAISERLDKAGADLVSLSEKIDTTTAAGKMVFRMLAVLAEFERDLIGERTAVAMQHKRARREYTGGRSPYGWRVSGDGVNLEADESEQRVITTARQLRQKGLSLRTVAAQLMRRGVRQRNGAPWHPQSVKVVLQALAA